MAAFWVSVLWGSHNVFRKFVFLLLTCLIAIIRPVKEPEREEEKLFYPYIDLLIFLNFLFLLGPHKPSSD